MFVCFHFPAGPKIIVRTEEVLIVCAVLLLWVGAIALFFNRWGKIRMLEPYQPKFQQQHRSSCPLVEMEAIPALKHPSFSRISMGCSLQMPTSGRMGSISGPSGPSMYTCNTVRGKHKISKFSMSGNVFELNFLSINIMIRFLPSQPLIFKITIKTSSVTAPPLYSRSRQNSVFVGPQTIVAQKPSRKYQSAMDIHSLVLDEAPERCSGSPEPV